MTLLRLVTRSLRHYRHTSLLVLLGLTVAGAVITGSLVIGDSMRGSLRDAALVRLGDLTHALIAPRLFRQALADDLAAKLPATPVAAVLQTTGAAANAESDATVPEVTVWGVAEDFWKFYPRLVAPPLTDRSVAINASLARDLGVEREGAVLLTVNRPAQAGAGSIFGHRERDQVLLTLRVTVGAILPDNSGGDLRLDAQSARPRNVFVSRQWLAEQLGQAGKANVLLAATATDTAALEQALRQAVTVADQGLSIRQKPGGVSLSSDTLTLTATQREAANGAASKLGTTAQAWLVYLATRLQVGARRSAYAVIAGLDASRPFTFKAGGGAAPAQGEVWLNEWVAADLQAKVGDNLTLDYLVPSPDGAYPTRTLKLRVGAIVALAGSGADRTIMPEYKGLTDAATLGDWNPPFPVDMSRITPRDETYWDRYRATPKAFLNLQQVQAMWRQAAVGQTAAPPVEATSLEVPLPVGQQPTVFADAFTGELAAALAGSGSDLRFLPVRKQALAASQGTSDFGGLFLGLSMFLVASGAALAGMLLRLSLDQRAAQAGLMLSTGLPQRLVARSLFAEGALLTVAGTVLGVPAGVGYAALLLAALSRWWQGALGATPGLWLHVTAPSLLSGLLSGLLIGLATTQLSLRRLLSRPVLDLLAGWQALREPARQAPVMTKAALITTVTLLVVAAVSLGLHLMAAVAAFFVSGFLLLVSGLLGLRLAFAGSWRAALGAKLARLAWRNAAANHARSLLVVGLLAGATFLIVAVAANTRDLSRVNTRDRHSGTGGYSLVATSTVPLTYDLGTAKGRENLGLAAEDEPLLAQCGIVSLLASPGEDISCLNLTRPQAPRLLAMPYSLETDIYTGKRFQARLSLRRAGLHGSDDTACVGDADSVMWTLHSGLGKIYTTMVGTREMPLWIEGLIPGSIFARELLIRETDFQRLFPTITHPSYFLIETPPGQETAVADALRRNFGDLGLQVKTTGEVLAEFGRVQNTYLSMFLALGGLGLALGTLGMIAVILRSVLERRRELALLAATGFEPRELARLLLLEHGGLLLVGLALGTLAALVAVAPQLVQAQAAVNWWALGGTLTATLAVGLASCLLAVRMARRGNLLTALRSE